mmetsp:Transcript_21469/g.83281  ORF Transcript_21469/g.83281 Transcript_21469/m.83281 type:complete len:214 (+) Transcript_21469:3-644(+)
MRRSLVAMSSAVPRVMEIIPFAYRQFDDPSYTGTRITGMTKEEFVNRVNTYFAENKLPLHDGYAPFCKHVFVENFVGEKVGAMPITDKNRSLLKSDYHARTESELPVLIRWFDKADVDVPEAKFLDIILYSREQVTAETKAMGEEDPLANCGPETQWGIVSVKAQLESQETPMAPITMLRNALGKEEGGSGVPLDREKYLQSVAYWKGHASIA